MAVRLAGFPDNGGFYYWVAWKICVRRQGGFSDFFGVIFLRGFGIFARKCWGDRTYRCPTYALPPTPTPGGGGPVRADFASILDDVIGFFVLNCRCRRDQTAMSLTMKQRVGMHKTKAIQGRAEILEEIF